MNAKPPHTTVTPPARDAAAAAASHRTRLAGGTRHAAGSGVAAPAGSENPADAARTGALASPAIREEALDPDRMDGAPKASAAGGVAAVDRAFTILAAFRPDDRSLSLAELAARTGLHKSTILRLAESLQRHEYLLRLQSGRYQIGPMPFLLGAIYQRSLSLSDIVVPLMVSLTKQTGESTTFFVPHGDRRVCLHRIDSRHEIREHLRAGDTFPLTRGSPGAVLSAFSGARGERFDRIRAEYYDIAYDERRSDPVGISVPVFGAGQTLLGSMTISGPSTRISREALEQMRAILLDAGAQATRALGGDATALERMAQQFMAQER